MDFIEKHALGERSEPLDKPSDGFLGEPRGERALLSDRRSLPWDWVAISSNSTITVDFIKKHIDKPSDGFLGEPRGERAVLGDG